MPYVPPSGGGGGGSPGGSNTQVQFNNSGAFGGITGATTNGTVLTLVAPVLGTPASGVATNLTGTASGLTAGNVTTNANLTGVITSSGNATSTGVQTGTGSTFVMSASPTGTGTWTLPIVTGTSFNGLSVTTTTGTLTIANGKILTASNSLTFAGTDATTMTFPTTSASIARTDQGQTFTGTNFFGSGTFSGTLNTTSNLFVNNTSLIYWTGRTIMTSPADGAWQFSNQAQSNNLNLSVPTSNTLQLGLADAASPVAQTLSVQSATGTNTAGAATRTEIASLATGSGLPGDYIIKTGFQGVSSTGTATFTNSSANIGYTNSFVANQAVQFTSSGTLPTNFALNTTYYVIATGLSVSNIQVSATVGGSAITAGSAGSGTQTLATATVQQAGIAALTIKGGTQAANFAASVNLVSGQVLAWNGDTAISRISAGTLAIGQGAQGDLTGVLGAAAFNIGNGTNGVFGNSKVILRGDIGVFGFAPGSNATIAPDTNISRDSAGVLDIGTGAQGSKAGSINLTNLTATGLVTTAQMKFTAGNTTGVGVTAVGTNCPAVTPSAPYTWMTVTTSDGSTGYIPIWK